MRFPPEADSQEEAVSYLRQRAEQAAYHGYTLTEIRHHEHGPTAIWDHRDEGPHCTPYVLHRHRHSGHYRLAVGRAGMPVITLGECRLERYLEVQSIPYKVLPDRPFEDAYRLISEVYGDQRAVRSGRYYMSHIDEGIHILRDAHVDTQAAFAVHPIFQDTVQLLETLDRPPELRTRVVALAMEYRAVANSYLPRHHSLSLEGPKISALEEVNQMLVADKIQNRKDLELFNRDLPGYALLQDYFQRWFDALGVSDQTYQEWKSKLNHPYTVRVS